MTTVNLKIMQWGENKEYGALFAPKLNHGCIVKFTNQLDHCEDLVVRFTEGWPFQGSPPFDNSLVISAGVEMVETIATDALVDQPFHFQVLNSGKTLATLQLVVGKVGIEEIGFCAAGIAAKPAVSTQLWIPQGELEIYVDKASFNYNSGLYLQDGNGPEIVVGLEASRHEWLSPKFRFDSTFSISLRTPPMIESGGTEVVDIFVDP